MIRTEATSKNESSWDLLPLTPEYLEREHYGYVNAINTAFANPDIRNIALSGTFGVGKSSVLKKVVESHKDRVVELSLSTLAPIDWTHLDNSVPKQATTPTNRIQQEIVKQLLYRADPRKTPGSRFQRIEPFAWPREIALASLIGLVISLIFLLSGWTERIFSTLFPTIELGVWAHGLFLIATSAAVFLARYLAHGRIQIRQLSAGTASVTLDDNSVSYFDQYLDEIVYFFEISERDIVIFEDIDRFDDSYIFETLRSLNTLLNSSPQIKKPIRFLYAIKDSIFDPSETPHGERPPQTRPLDDPAKIETARANRTKFFDLVIPVVPFITHQSARDLAIQILNSIDHQIDETLIDLAARHVPDMRMLKNARNEFIVFRDRVFSEGRNQLNLNDTNLFAMVLYKNTHLVDFENIRLGTSNLDTIYDRSRALVTQNIRSAEREIISLNQKIMDLDNIDKYCQELGSQLIEHVHRTIRATKSDPMRGQYRFEGATRKESELLDRDFWIAFSQAQGEPELHFRITHAPRQRDLRFSRSDIMQALGTDLQLTKWNDADREELRRKCKQRYDDLRFLRSADMSDLIRRPELLVDFNGADTSLDSIAREILTPGLAYHLIRSGYVNRNFTLYTSIFHSDRVSAAATNFLIHHVDRNIMDEHFNLEPEDVEAVLRERSDSDLKEPALYNIAILDYLLETRDSRADVMLQSLKTLGADQKRFLQAYLVSATNRLQFIGRFSQMSDRVFQYLVSEIELDGQERLQFVASALEHIVYDINYQVDPAVAEYIHSSSHDLLSRLPEPQSRTHAQTLSNVFSEAGVRLLNLEVLDERLRAAFIGQHLYAINNRNLQVVLEDCPSLALDDIRSFSRNVYNYLLMNIDAYLAAIHRGTCTVNSNDSFVCIVEDVWDHNADQVDAVIARASDGCTVANILDISESVWPHLARANRFTSTLSNVSNYIATVGALDHGLANALRSNRAIQQYEETEECNREQLAAQVLAAQEVLPEAELRATLVCSLELPNYLDVEQIPVEEGELFSRLIEHDIIEDSPDTYARLAGTEWDTRERVIEQSRQFISYISPEIVHGDVKNILESKKIDSDIKSCMVDRADEFVQHCSRAELTALARFSIDNKKELTSETVYELAKGGVPARYVVPLMRPHFSTVSDESLFHTLEELGGDFPNLTSVGTDSPRIADSEDNRALLDELNRREVVSTYKVDVDHIKVYKKRK